MSMRNAQDRVRHALLFEVCGLLIFIPGGAVLFDLPADHLGVVGIVTSVVATIWNFFFNLGFDKALLSIRGHVRKTLSLRVFHAVLFELSLTAILLLPIAWYLDIGLLETLLMDLSMVVFYTVYGFVFNLAYDRLFPIETGAAGYA